MIRDFKDIETNKFLIYFMVCDFEGIPQKENNNKSKDNSPFSMGEQ